MSRHFLTPHRRTVAPWLGVLALAWLPAASGGCHKKTDEERLGVPAPVTGPSAPPESAALTKTDILLQILSIPHAEVQARLGPHRIESHTHYSITPVGPARPVPEVQPGFRPGGPAQPFDAGEAWESGSATLDETRSVHADSSGLLALSSQSDHGYGFEAVVEGGLLYLRMKNAPFVRRRAEGDEVTRLRSFAYEPGLALVEAVAQYVALGTPVELLVNGRPAWQVKLSRREGGGGEGGGPRRPVYSKEKAWRNALRVDVLEGSAVIDRQRSVLLEISLHTRFQTKRGPVVPGTPAGAEDEEILVDAEHTQKVAMVGAAVPAVTVPKEWNDPPVRSRPTAEQRELLNGLLPARP